MLEQHLACISKIREMLKIQALSLQKTKDIEMLKDWRRDRRSFEKSINKAANRTEADIPFAVNLNDLPPIFKSFRKINDNKKGKRRQGPPQDINKKFHELLQSLKNLQISTNSTSLTPRTEQKLMATEILKISKLQDEIHELRIYNERMTSPFNDPCTRNAEPYKPLPSIII